MLISSPVRLYRKRGHVFIQRSRLEATNQLPSGRIFLATKNGRRVAALQDRKWALLGHKAQTSGGFSGHGQSIRWTSARAGCNKWNSSWLIIKELDSILAQLEPKLFLARQANSLPRLPNSACVKLSGWNPARICPKRLSGRSAGTFGPAEEAAGSLRAQRWLRADCVHSPH